MRKSNPAWIRCDLCDDFLCNIHGKHVADCKCPPLEQWGKIDPYTTPMNQFPKKWMEKLR